MPRFHVLLQISCLAIAAGLCCTACREQPAPDQASTAVPVTAEDEAVPSAEDGQARRLNPADIPDPDHNPQRIYSEEELAGFEAVLSADSSEQRQKLLDDGAVLDSEHLIDYISMGRMNIVVRMIAAGVDLNAPEASGKRPLAEAILQNDPWLVDTMIAHGADPLLADEAEGGTGRSMLHYATKMDNGPLVQRLIDLGVPVSVTDSGDQTPLEVAATYGDAQAMRVLLDNGADPNRRDRGGSAPLLLAAASGRLEVARMLLAEGVDVNFQHERGWTPVLLAIYYDHDELVQFLLDNGASLDASLDTGFGAAAIAAQLGDPQMLRLVMDAGAPLDGHAGSEGRNLIHICALNHLSEFIPELVDAGLDPAQEDLQGNTPLDLARMSEDREAERILMEITGAEPAAAEGGSQERTDADRQG